MSPGAANLFPFFSEENNPLYLDPRERANQVAPLPSPRLARPPLPAPRRPLCRCLALLLLLSPLGPS